MKIIKTLAIICTIPFFTACNSEDPTEKIDVDVVELSPPFELVELPLNLPEDVEASMPFTITNHNDFTIREPNAASNVTTEELLEEFLYLDLDALSDGQLLSLRHFYSVGHLSEWNMVLLADWVNATPTNIWLYMGFKEYFKSLSSAESGQYTLYDTDYFNRHYSAESVMEQLFEIERTYSTNTLLSDLRMLSGSASEEPDGGGWLISQTQYEFTNNTPDENYVRLQSSSTTESVVNAAQDAFDSDVGALFELKVEALEVFLKSDLIFIYESDADFFESEYWAYTASEETGLDRTLQVTVSGEMLTVHDVFMEDDYGNSTDEDFFIIDAPIVQHKISRSAEAIATEPGYDYMLQITYKSQAACILYEDIRSDSSPFAIHFRLGESLPFIDRNCDGLSDN